MDDNLIPDEEENEASFLTHMLLVLFALLFIAVAAFLVGWAGALGIMFAGLA